MAMEEIESLLKVSVAEFERILNKRTVVGETIVVGDNTLIPLLSLGFGFSAGGGGTGKGEMASKDTGKGEGIGMGVGGGGGVKPIAIIIIDKNGARVEPIKGGTASMMDSLGSVIGKVVEVSNKKSNSKES